MDANPLEPYVPLSKRETDILQLLADNKSDREIADQLVIALTTVKWYNRQIFNKLGVNSRREAVKMATRLGLVGGGAAKSTTKHNLPAQITPFIGRHQELDALSRLLITPQHRLVTLLAPGGMGKTRLALAVAESLLSHYADGVYFVSLASLSVSEQIVPALAEAMGFHFMNDQRAPLQQLMDYFKRKRMLLVLDNFEHLLDGSALVSDLLEGAATVSVLVTSRERLNLQGETVFPLGGLAYPDGKSQTQEGDYAAVDLFNDRTRRTSTTVTDDHIQTVTRICQLVQGMPLAIELAAAWAGSLSLSEIAAEIQRSADFLQTTMRNVPDRLRSVRTVFESTWQRLSEDERRVFRRLSVFQGGFTREAAQVVVAASVTLLAGLVHKALLYWNSIAGRYTIHELLRQYAAAELDAAGEMQAIRDAHCDYFGRLAREQALALRSQEQLVALAGLDADVDNVRAAFQRATEIGTPEAIDPFGDLWLYYEIRGWWVEGSKLFGAAVAKLEPIESVTLGRLLACYLQSLERIGRNDLWPQMAQRSADMLSRLGAEGGNLMPFWHVGQAAMASGPDFYATALSIMQDVLQKAKAFDDMWSASVVMYLVGLMQSLMGQLTEAKATALETLVLDTQINNTWAMPWPHTLLGDIAVNQFNFEEAEYHYGEALRCAHMMRNQFMIAGSLGCLAIVALAKGELDLARHIADDLLELYKDLGLVGWMTSTLNLIAEIEITSGNANAAKKVLREAILTLQVLPADSFVIPCVIMARVLVHDEMMVQAVELFSVYKRYQDYMYQEYMLLPAAAGQTDAILTTARAVFPTEVYDAAWASGQTLTVEEVRAKLLSYL